MCAHWQGARPDCLVDGGRAGILVESIASIISESDRLTVGWTRDGAVEAEGAISQGRQVGYLLDEDPAVVCG
jgi:hypothetical protein